MDANKLLHWMSHLGEGTWESFKKGVEQLSSANATEPDRDYVTQLRFRLSELADVDFYPEKRRRWKIVSPFLARFPERAGEATLCGGRTPALISSLEATSQKNSCTLTQAMRANLPDKIQIVGEEDALTALGAEMRLPCSLDYAADLARSILPIRAQLSKAPEEELGIRWKRRYFDLLTHRWTEEPCHHTACECISEYGRRAAYVQVSRTKTVRMPKREAIYAAAALTGAVLAKYDNEGQCLTIPMHAPLPDLCARLACVSSGSVGKFDNGSVTYSPVGSRIAEIILASLGQRFR